MDKLNMMLTNPLTPLVFTKELSYLEMVRNVNSKVDEIIDFINKLDETIHSYTDSEIAKLKKEFDGKVDEIYSFINKTKKDIENDYNNKIETLRSYCDKKFKLLSMDIVKYFNSMMEAYTHGDNVVLLKSQLAVNELEKKINRINENGYKIQNPTKGVKDHVEKVVENVYDALRFFCFTVDEIEVGQWTIEDYESMTVIDFEIQSKYLLYIKYKIKVISPITGLNSSHQLVLNQLYNYLQNGSYNAHEFETLDVAVDDFENNGYDVFQFDTDNKIIFNPDSQRGRAIYFKGDLKKGTQKLVNLDLSKKILAIFFVKTGGIGSQLRFEWEGILTDINRPFVDSGEWKTSIYSVETNSLLTETYRAKFKLNVSEDGVLSCEVNPDTNLFTEFKINGISFPNMTTFIDNKPSNPKVFNCTLLLTQ